MKIERGANRAINVVRLFFTGDDANPDDGRLLRGGDEPPPVRRLANRARRDRDHFFHLPPLRDRRHLPQRLDASLDRVIGQRPPLERPPPELDHFLLFVDDAITRPALLDDDHVDRVRPDVDGRDAVAGHAEGDYGARSGAIDRSPSVFVRPDLFERQAGIFAAFHALVATLGFRDPRYLNLRIERNAGNEMLCKLESVGIVELHRDPFRFFESRSHWVNVPRESAPEALPPVARTAAVVCNCPHHDDCIFYRVNDFVGPIR